MLASYWSGVSYAAWYGSHPQFLNNANCSADGQPDGMWPGGPYVVQAHVVGPGGGPGVKTCLYWDATDPWGSATNASATWNKNTISVTLGYSDYGWSNMSTARYAWDAGCSGGASYSNGQVISQGSNGDHTLYLCTWDGAGNSTINQAFGPYRHDHNLPTVSATLSLWSWRNTDINPVVLSVNDTGWSGIKYAKYSWINNAACHASGTSFSNGFSFSKNWNGADVLYLCVEDWAGNQWSWNGSYYLDKVPPVISATNSTATWKNADISITLSATDTAYSWLNAPYTKYRWDNADCVGWGIWYSNWNVIVLSTEWAHVLYLCARDNAGNIVTWSGDYKLDKTYPILNANNYSPLWRNTPVSITLTSTDILYSGLNAPYTKYRWDNSDCVGWWTVYTNWQVIIYGVEWDHLLYLCNRDIAGNITTWGPQPYRIDLTNPISSALTYANAPTNGWQGYTNITLNWTASDPIAGSPAGRSNIKEYDIRVYRSTSQWTPVTLYATLPAATTTNSYIYPWVDWYAYKFEVCARDNATNVCSAWLTSTDIARVDMIPPSAVGLTDSSAINMIAGSGLTFNLNYNDGWAPVWVNYHFENNIAPGSLDALSTSSFIYVYGYNRDLTLVDNDRGGNGGRQISIPIDQICDQAGWCINGSPLKTITHYTYASAVSGTLSSTSTSLTDGSAVADGSSKIFDITLRDQFNNQIVPASGIARVVNMTLTGITNAMFLNQYNRSTASGSSIYVTAPNNPIDQMLSFGTWVSVQTFSNPMTSAAGSYPLIIKAYTPTANSYLLPTDAISDNTASFAFTSKLDVSSSSIDPGRTFTQSLTPPIFKPLYVATLTGNLRDGGFIEGTEQTNTVLITNNNAVLTPIVAFQLEFSGASAVNFDLYGGSAGNSGTTIATRNAMVVNPGYSPTNLLYTKLVQKQNTQVSNLSNLQLSTHFAYTLDSKSIIYNADIVGKTGWFWSNTLVVLWNQVWIKVIGPIGSNVIGSIVTGQFDIGTSIFDWFSRSTVRNNMRKTIAVATRNTVLTSFSNIITSTTTLNGGAGMNGTKLDKWVNTSIMRLEKTGWNVTLALVAWISGKRTIVLKWANLYITNNMYYSPTDPNSILGVVVQKDENGNGWNIYINPSVTNIVGTYVIDGSIMSSNDGINPIWTSNIALLKNQLYIYGSIVSENTIGGSRMSPLKCPSLVNTSCATIDEAQKYDLNYLRRYYLYNGEPFGWILTKVIWDGTCPGGVCSGFNTNLIKKFTSSVEDFARYPVIIEYNPLIRTNPPIGFEESRE